MLAPCRLPDHPSFRPHCQYCGHDLHPTRTCMAPAHGPCGCRAERSELECRTGRPAVDELSQYAEP